MKLRDRMGASGALQIVLTDKDGNIKLDHLTENLVVDTGLAYIAGRMVDASASVMSHMAVGTGSTAAADTDTALNTELARVALTTTTLVTTNVANDAVEYVGTFGAGVATGALVEAGLLNAGSGGVMMTRTVFGVVTKAADDILTITWRVTIA